ncbi:hypothetical protein THAOC_18745, partial [Thalassiosira oceanica]
DKRKGRSKDEEDAAGTPPSGRGKFMGMKAKGEFRPSTFGSCESDSTVQGLTNNLLADSLDPR